MEDRPLHAGVLISGAGGGVWWLRDDDSAPIEIEDRELAERVQAFAAGLGGQFMTTPLPEALFKQLDAAYGPLSPLGIFHCKTHQLGRSAQEKSP